MTDYGDVWRQSDVKLWDNMWAAHKGSLMTEAVLAEALKVDGLVEVGCGAGHMLRELLKRGWRGEYAGFEIGDKASAKAAWVVNNARLKSSYVCCGDFVPAMVANHWHSDAADLLIARGVAQHHAHWSILPQVALRFVPRVVLGIGYTTLRTDRHEGGWQKKGCYDVRVSPELLKVEAKALGMHVERCEIMKRGKRRELFVVLTKASEALS